MTLFACASASTTACWLLLPDGEPAGTNTAGDAGPGVADAQPIGDADGVARDAAQDVTSGRDSCTRVALRDDFERPRTPLVDRGWSVASFTGGTVEIVGDDRGGQKLRVQSSTEDTTALSVNLGPARCLWVAYRVEEHIAPSNFRTYNITAVSHDGGFYFFGLGAMNARVRPAFNIDGRFQTVPELELSPVGSHRVELLLDMRSPCTTAPTCVARFTVEGVGESTIPFAMRGEPSITFHAGLFRAGNPSKIVAGVTVDDVEIRMDR